jgi:FAD/FMN-containing dehydrogenase
MDALIKPEFVAEMRTLLGTANVVEGGESLEALSKDFYWYSPVLKRLLDDKVAGLAVRVGSVAELRAVLAACSRAGVPVVARGGGTGNYGQCVPLHGGVVLDLTRMDRIIDISADGVLRTETGARLGTIEIEARKRGWELRCMPSTWMKSSIGGFFCGGSGGIGSITWGGIGAPGNVKSVTLMSCEASPRLIRLEEAELAPGLRGYGTTGIMVEIEMRLAPKRDYDQLLFGCADWGTILDWTDFAARKAEWRKRLVTQFEWPIPSYFKPLARYFRPGQHVSLFLIDRSQTDELVASAAAAGVDCVYRVPLPDPPRPPFVSDYTYNHTTLWAMKSDPQFTYLQAGFAANFREQFVQLQSRFPGEILLHLEWMSGGAKPDPRGQGFIQGDQVFVASIPLVRFVSEARLREIIDYCAGIGVGIANPHTYLLEEGGHDPNIGAKRSLKERMDPGGLLNPGKMGTFPLNPFAG